MTNESIRRHLSPGNIIYGPGALMELPAELPEDGTYLLMTDQGLARTGIADKVAKALDSGGVRFHVFDRVESDPAMEIVEAAVTDYKRLGCTGVIGLGGGSAMDAAKAAAVRVSAPGTLEDYSRGRPVEEPLVPLYAIPTTAGTGSEATRVAVITNTATKAKMAIRGPYLAPRRPARDPPLPAAPPPHTAPATGADALTHAVEAYTSLMAGPITNALALAAVRMIGQNLQAMVANPADTKAAEQMLLASCMAGQAFSNASVGLAHSLGEPLGAYHHVGHGLACALYLPAVMAFNLPATPEKFADIAEALGIRTAGMDSQQAAEASVKAVRQLFTDIKLPLTFDEAGIDFKLEAQMIEDVWPQFSTRCNPRSPSPEEVEALYKAPGA